MHMKTCIFLLVVVLCSVSASVGCFWKKSREARFMEIAHYVAGNCAGSVVYDSLPVRYTRALSVSNDSADRFLTVMQGYVERRECPE